MQINIERSFEDYIRSGNETTEALLAGPNELVQLIKEFHGFFIGPLWRRKQEISALAALLSMNAFNLYLSACRMALTGHAAATFPLFRTALESACYAFIITHDASLESIWMNRGRDTAAHKKCRRTFQFAVSDTAKKLAAHDPELGAMINEGYEAAIDFGAHPNIKSIFHHVRTTETDSTFEVSLVALHAEDAFELNRSLVACVDYGLALALVLANCLPSPDETICGELQRLNEMKNALMMAGLDVAAKEG